MMRFSLLASGSKGNCFVLKDGTTCIVIDCGSTKKYLTKCFDELGISRQEIDALLITHDHSDHIAQINMFADTAIYAPVEIEDVETFRIRPMKPFVIETLKITPLPLSHDALNTTGFVIENGTEKLVYITDTGYVNQKYIPLLYDADYIVMESNHDTQMLMRTRRPQYLKARICGDQGHLCNEDCAEILAKIVSANTKMILLAHISQEANTREKALAVNSARLKEMKGFRFHPELVICAAGQFEITGRGMRNEKVDCGSVCDPVGMERLADIQTADN